MINAKVSLTKDSRSIRKKPWLVRWPGEYNPITDKQRRYSKSFARKKDAEAFKEQKERDLDAGLPRDEVNLTLEKLWLKFERSQRGLLKEGSFKHYEETYKRLKNFFNPNTLVRHIRAEHAEEFLSQLNYISPKYKNIQRSISDSSWNRILRGCKRIFTKALEWQYIRVNPFANIKQVKAKTHKWHRMTPDEFESLLNASLNIRQKAFYAILYGCGLRTGEAINLMWDGRNIDFEKNRITLFNRHGTKLIPPFYLKDHETRSVPMPNYVINLLLELQEQTEHDCPFVFLDKDKWERVQQKWIRFQEQRIERKWNNKELHGNLLRQFQRACKRAGIISTDKLTVHCMRKSWACNLADVPTPNKTLMKMGGWSSIETCEQYYLQSTDENEKKAIQELEKLVSIK